MRKGNARNLGINGAVVTSAPLLRRALLMFRSFALLICCLLLAGKPVAGQSAAEILARRFPAAQYGIWQLVSETSSPAAHHYTFRPTVGGRWLWPGTARLTVARRGRVINCLPDQLTHLDSLRGFTDAPPPAAHRATVIEQYLREKVGVHNLPNLTIRNPLPVWYVNDATAHTVRAGYLLTWGGSDSRIGAWEVLLDEATGEEISPPRDLYSYHHTSLGPRDTTATALVFRPDPLSTAQRPYGRPFIDSLDTDRAVLNQQRAPGTLRLTFAADSFRLRNPWFEIAEFDAPARAVVAAPTAAGLQFTRAQAGFQQVNALFHLTRCREYVNALGFDSLINQRVRVDVSGMSGADQSRFSPLDTTLSFGEGGVDDAEDADVLTHEYFHALGFAAAPNTNTGLERRTLDEANADYWAAAHSARLLGPNAYGAEQVYNWDGHNEFWAGRWVISPKIYPRDLVGSIYLDADIWSSTLWQIRQTIPDTIADRLFLQHLYAYAPNLTMSQAAMWLLQADTLLYGAAHADTIYHFFYERHILGNHNVVGLPGPAETLAGGAQLWASDAFARGEAARFRTPIDTDVWLLSATGAVVWRGHATAAHDMLIPARNLAPGLYVLRFGAGRGTARLVRW